MEYFNSYSYARSACDDSRARAFWTACLLKIKVYEVSIFVGPRLFHWKRKGVEYSIRAVPLGAYVRFTDIDEEGKPVESDAPELLINNPRWKGLLLQ